MTTTEPPATGTLPAGQAGALAALADETPFVPSPLLRLSGLLCVMRRPHVDRIMRRIAP